MHHELRNPMKSLINIKKNDNKCFLWCHIGHLNPLKIHRKKDYCKTEKKNNNSINVFCYENDLTYPLYVSKVWKLYGFIVD